MNSDLEKMNEERNWQECRFINPELCDLLDKERDEWFSSVKKRYGLAKTDEEKLNIKMDETKKISDNYFK